MPSFKDYKGKEKLSPEAMELVKKFAQKYEGVSEKEMLKSIYIEAEKSRKNGTLSNSDLDNFYQMFSPMLNVFQRKKLEQVIAELKKK